LITEAERTDSGHRLYPESVFERLKKIEMLKRHRTLQEVKELLDEQDAEDEKKNEGKSA
jgi:DNA-binding transcriptional MerR regulator